MSETPSISTNPLVNYRAPKTAGAKKHPFRVGTHFHIRREDARHDVGTKNIYPGDFRYKPDPTLEIDFALWEDNGDSKSTDIYLNMTIRNGFQIAMAKDFDVVDDRLKMAWKGDLSKRLTYGGSATNTLVLMWRTGDAADQQEAFRQRLSDDVQKTAEEKEEAMRDRFASLGAKIKTTLVDDDERD